MVPILFVRVPPQLQLCFAVARYASLFFVAGVANESNELMVLEILHRYVEVLDRYFGNVWCGLLALIYVHLMGVTS